jgi:hypothetical protein
LRGRTICNNYSLNAFKKVDMKKSGALVLAVLGLVLSLAPTRSSLRPADEDRETDPAILKKLEWFEDVKFGLMMH